MIDIDQRVITAHHEAGHAVAAEMRGDGEVRALAIEPTDQYLGKTWFRAKPADLAFVTFAGPWAEARCRWPAKPPGRWN